jgi:hypothetical protein
MKLAADAALFAACGTLYAYAATLLYPRARGLMFGGLVLGAFMCFLNK